MVAILKVWLCKTNKQYYTVCMVHTVTIVECTHLLCEWVYLHDSILY